MTWDELCYAIQVTLDREALFTLNPSRRPKPTPQELIGEIVEQLREVAEKLEKLGEVL